MGLLDEFKRLAHPYEDEEDDDFEDDYEPAPRPVDRRDRDRSRDRIPERRSAPSSYYDAPSDLDSDRRSNKVVNIRAATQLQVVLVKPDCFDNASEIADHLREKRTVVLNLEKTEKDVSRRIVDFLSGVAYANNGKIQRVATSTFIITPYDVDISGDEILDELESSGMYF